MQIYEPWMRLGTTREYMAMDPTARMATPKNITKDEVTCSGQYSADNGIPGEQ